MGLLDDAIREHLELKRRHGADPHEVERQEQEALGSAVRRGEPAVTGEAPEGADVAPAVEDAPEGAGLAPAVGEAPEAEDLAPAAPFDAEAEPYDDRTRVIPPASGAVAASEVEAEEEPAAAEPGPAEPPAEDEPEPPSRARAAEAGEDEDVLEETPDFLQEAPEHDRLWFEQKPPRDFDWDR
jgi:hypothetical protein